VGVEGASLFWMFDGYGACNDVRHIYSSFPHASSSLDVEGGIEDALGS
jgi:hypothetical protein